MDALEEVVVGGPNDLSLHIVKGKRSKRSKPLSPISFTMLTTPTPHSSSAPGDDDNTASGASASGGGFAALILHDTPTAEDEYMARCLMLLSRGGTPPYKEENDVAFNNNNNNNNNGGSKFCSKRYVETTAVAGGAKVGMYVYECKTCGRTFPTFQALGGHRTSHTKEKPALAAIEAAKRPLALAFYDGGDEDYDPSPPPNKTARLPSASFSPLHFNDSAKSSPRIHECAYCGAEFTSGQALGGHMRRHRGTPATLVASCSFDEKRVFQKENGGNSLNLDLNLGPAGGDHKDRRRRPENQEQHALPVEEPTVFMSSSAIPPIVGCKPSTYN